MPPLRRGPDRVTSLSCRQRGLQILLSGTLPDKNQDGGPLAAIQEVRIIRLNRGGLTGPGMVGRSGQRSAMRQFTREAKTIASITGDALGKATEGRRIFFTDSEPLTGTVPEKGQELTYAMTVVDANKRSSPLSQLATVRMLPPPSPPSDLRFEISEKRIRLSWEPHATVAAAETVLYNLYRTEREGVFLEKPRNEKPLPQPFYEDEDFSFGKTYYFAASSLIVDKGAMRESENSPALRVSPVDVYPPAVPTGLAVSAEKGVIKLYWFPNSESDLGGYWIYRSEKEGGEFVRIGMADAAASTYVDSTTRPGVKYYYAMTAVDRATPPNESARSEVHGDRLPSSQPTSGDKQHGEP